MRQPTPTPKAAPNPTPDNRQPFVGFRLPPELLADLDARAAREDRPRSYVIREALAKYLR